MALCISLLPVSAAAGDSTPPEVETVYNSATEAAAAVRQAVLAGEESITVCVAFDSDEFEDEEEGNAVRMLDATIIEENILKESGISCRDSESDEPPLGELGACRAKVSYYPYGERYIAQSRIFFSYTNYETPEEAMPFYKHALLDRDEYVAVSVKSAPREQETEDIRIHRYREILDLAYYGNSLEYQVSSNNPQYSYYQYEGQTFNWIFVEIRYTLTQGQDKTVQAKVTEVIDSLSLDGKSEYEKVFAIYNYIVSTVSYATNDIYCYDAYGALINKRSACDGISEAMYLLCSAAGLDVCKISGLSMGPDPTEPQNGLHAWNIVRIGGVYYNLDATWDLGETPEEWGWFLLNNYYFEHYHSGKSYAYPDPCHSRSAGFRTDEFTALHPIDVLNYGDHAVWIREGETYDVSIAPNGSCSLVFCPSKSGRYTLSSTGSLHTSAVESTSFRTPLDTRKTENGTDFSNTYRLVKGEYYRFEIHFPDWERGGSMSVCLRKDPVENVTVTDVFVEDIKYYQGDWVSLFGTWGTYYNYDPMRAAAAVSLSNGEVIHGTLGDVVEHLNDVYELDVSEAAEGDNQYKVKEWGIGRYPLSIRMGDSVAEFCLTIAENPFKSVEPEPFPSIYDDEFIEATYIELPDGSYAEATPRHYRFVPGNITVTTDEKTYQGSCEEVYAQVCADLDYTFQPIPTEVILPRDTKPGIHDIEVRLFGVQTAWHFEMLKANPIGSIHAANRIVTESDRREVHIEIPDGNGGIQTVSYLAYPYEPLSVLTKYKNGNGSILGTPEEVLDNLAQWSDYHEPFVYTGIDTPDAPWTAPGRYTVTISLGDVSAEYSVFVKSDHELTVGSIAEEEITKPGETVYFAFTPEENAVYKFTSAGSVAPESSITCTIFDHDMQDLTSSRQLGDGGFTAACLMEAGKTYYLGAGYFGDQTGPVAVTVQKLFELEQCSVQKNVTLYENEGTPEEEWVRTGYVQYMFYDLYPKGILELHITAEPHVIRGTFKEVADILWEHFGIDPDYRFMTGLSATSPWTAGNTYNAHVIFWGTDYNMDVTIKEGPILSMGAENALYIVGTGREETGPNGDTWRRYDTQPALLTAHTVDGDISGTPEEIRDHIRDDYGLTLELTVTGDDQSWESHWGAGPHEMLITLGSITADYRVIIEEAESLSVSGEFKTDYLVGEAFDPSGITVTAALSSGGLVDVTEFALFTGFDSTSAGEKTVFVRCGGGETSFTAAVRNRVMLTVLGDIRHEAEYPEDIHGLAAGGLSEWLAPTQYASGGDETAYGFVVRALSESDVLSLVLRTREQNGMEYIYAVGNGGLTLSEGDNHAGSGWFIAVNGTAVGDAYRSRCLTETPSRSTGVTTERQICRSTCGGRRS